MKPPKQGALRDAYIVVTMLLKFIEGEMSITTFSSREFNQDISRAKKAANQGPVFITDRGQPAHVLLSIEAYRKLAGGQMTLREALAQPGVADFEFQPPRIEGLVRSADLA